MRAVKAHLGTSPFASQRQTAAPRTHTRRHAGTPVTLPTLELAVPRTVVCYWHGCSQPAATRVAFQQPSLHAGETRDYCPRHTKQVAGQPGTAILATLHVHHDDDDDVDR